MAVRVFLKLILVPHSKNAQPFSVDVNNILQQC